MKRILVVDDEHDTCLTLTNVLEDNRVVVDAFDDPRLALENFRKDLYDLLILDIKMEKMNGLELYKEIKKIDNKVKVCFLTAGQFNYGPFIDVLGNLKCCYDNDKSSFCIDCCSIIIVNCWFT
jgi:YesN/AraC family two-component response regulator